MVILILKEALFSMAMFVMNFIPKAEKLFQLGVFYKNFNDPIELSLNHPV